MPKINKGKKSKNTSKKKISKSMKQKTSISKTVKTGFKTSLHQLNYKRILLIFCLIAFVFSILPVLRFDNPVAQTDGATHYIYAKTMWDEGFNAENPSYNWLGSDERWVKEYPPFVSLTFGAVMKVFGHDTLFINGLYGAPFIILALIFIFLTFKELTGSNSIGLLTAIFSAFNVRAYFTLHTGIYPAFVSYCLTFVLLYFTIKYFRNADTCLRNKWLFYMIVMNAVILLTHLQQGVFVILLQFMIGAGFYLQSRVILKVPDIDISLKKFDLKGLYPLLCGLFGIGVIGFIILKVFLLSGSRAGYITPWFSALTAANYGYPKVWTMFLITDGPIISIAAILGFIYLIKKNDWISVSLLSGSIFIVLFNILMIPGSAWIKNYFLRFNLTFFVFIAFAAAVLFTKMLSRIDWQKVGLILIIVCLLIQVIKSLAFIIIVDEAITDTELHAARFLESQPDGKTLFVVDDSERSTFKAFKWVLVTAKADDYDITNTIPDSPEHKYIYLDSSIAISEETLRKLDDYGIIYPEDPSEKGIWILVNQAYAGVTQ